MAATALSELPSQRGCTRRHAKYELDAPVRSGLRGPVDGGRRYVSEPVRQVVLYYTQLPCTTLMGPRKLPVAVHFRFVINIH
jgi:hypothetical protein